MYMTEFSLTKEEKEQYKNLNQLSTAKRIELLRKISYKISNYISDNMLEILASMPEVNAPSTKEIQKAMEKIKCANTNK